MLNAAARSVAGLRRSDHITNTLASFHRLRVPESAQFNLATLIDLIWFTASHHSTLLMTCATLPTFQTYHDYDQQALSSWRYPELGWLLSVTEPSVLLDQSCGRVYRAMSLSLSMLIVENSNISFLVCLSLDIDCFFLSRGSWGCTALHGMQTRSSDENSVRPSVCLSVRPSVRHTRGLWQNGRKICPDLYTIRKIIQPSFLRRRVVGGGDPFYVKFW